jgi:D-arabinose 1-dehydrogenase-like Zn-dependent alcohol dehydrogenase
VKFGRAFGSHVTVISRGLAKKEAAINQLGAHDYLDSTDAAALKAAANSFDFILDTVSAEHDLNALLEMLTGKSCQLLVSGSMMHLKLHVNWFVVDGTLCCVGAPPTPHKIQGFNLIGGRRSVCGSLIGGIRETQDMLDFCGRHNIVCDIELIGADMINVAYERTIASDVRYRFVIDTATL